MTQVTIASLLSADAGPTLDGASALRAARLGWQQLEQGQNEVGLVLLGDAVKSLPKNADVVSAYVFALARSHKPKEAAVWLERSIALSPTDIHLWVALGEAALAEKDYATAERALRRCLELDKDAKHPAGTRARALIKRTQKALANRS